MGLGVGVGDGVGCVCCADGDAAGVVVLDDGDGGFVEVVGGAQGGVAVDVVVVAHSFATEQFCLGDAGGCGGVDVEGTCLVGVFAVAQGFGAFEGESGEGGPVVGVFVLFELGCGPGGDGGVVGGGVGEGGGRQAAAFCQIEATCLGGFNDLAVLGWVDDDGYGVVVLGCCAHHGGAADVDFFDDGVLVCAGGYGLNEGVEVDDDQVKGLNLHVFEGIDVFLLAAVCQDAGVDAGVQGLDAAFEAFGEAGDVGDFCDGDAGCGDSGGG